MINTYIAIDIGASSGRMMKSQITHEGEITLEEVHRFKNGFIAHNNLNYWQIDLLIQEILVGLQKVKKSGIDSCYVGIDTWAVDYCLLDYAGERLSDPVAYRDQRTNHAVTKFAEIISLENLYEKTGIQIQPFNTIFQLFVEDHQKLQQAEKLLLIPDYLGYVFTGKMVTEKTNASTMQLLNAGTKTWDSELLAKIGIHESLFPPLVDPGTILGRLQNEKFIEFDLPNAIFINVASHDTASAVLGTPGIGEDWGYISSGTWSLLGIETNFVNISQKAFFENYTNEWGAHNTIRFLKNIMGMWLIQEVARVQKYRYSYVELAELAEQTPAFQQFIDVNDPIFLNPENMIESIQSYCRNTNQMVPKTPAELARCIFDNLALCYASELEKLEDITGTRNKICKLYIVGGGSNNRFLNQLTSDITNIPVEAGPGEATAIGNVIMQMVTIGEFSNIQEARQAIKNSFECHSYEPKDIDRSIINKYKQFLEGVKKNDSLKTKI
ncbi:rhamnulokinase [Bacillaceae bacterium Marseille-Q3522]|nr:rhamnulokinase [Bacillaceae bacterium Marseille-Q3522]